MSPSMSVWLYEQSMTMMVGARTGDADSESLVTKNAKSQSITLIAVHERSRTTMLGDREDRTIEALSGATPLEQGKDEVV